MYISYNENLSYLQQFKTQPTYMYCQHIITEVGTNSKLTCFNKNSFKFVPTSVLHIHMYIQFYVFYQLLKKITFTYLFTAVFIYLFIYFFIILNYITLSQQFNTQPTYMCYIPIFLYIFVKAYSVFYTIYQQNNIYDCISIFLRLYTFLTLCNIELHNVFSIVQYLTYIHVLYTYIFIYICKSIQCILYYLPIKQYLRLYQYLFKVIYISYVMQY
eukprot:TRINITY_DN6545_c1_g1_i1.p1 TRINITY_DN6545_c1_g1~~TRINITY_DN6545_c1_g1_i1.p1  ORF type:complete len:215 (-),score=-37.63 TRINITY_DN6545_c1_g1_i1:38-682(-)